MQSQKHLRHMNTANLVAVWSKWCAQETISSLRWLTMLDEVDTEVNYLWRKDFNWCNRQEWNQMNKCQKLFWHSHYSFKETFCMKKHRLEETTYLLFLPDTKQMKASVFQIYLLGLKRDFVRLCLDLPRGQSQHPSILLHIQNTFITL